MSTTPVWHRYVAIGDSFTEGMCDPEPEPPTGYIGWADRLALALDARARTAAETARTATETARTATETARTATETVDDAVSPTAAFAYANLAVRGRLLDDVVGPQLDAALAMSPDLVSMVGGGNDLLRPGVDLDRLAHRLDEAVARIRATGADVLLATPTDTRSAGMFRALRARHAIHTANLFTIAQNHGAHLLNLWGLKAIQDWRMWAADRIHLTSEGHARVAEAALLALGIPSSDAAWRDRLPPAPPAGRRQRLAEDREWAREHLAPWVQRRLQGESSGDNLAAKRPKLAPLQVATATPDATIPFDATATPHG